MEPTQLQSFMFVLVAWAQLQLGEPVYPPKKAQFSACTQTQAYLLTS